MCCDDNLHNLPSLLQAFFNDKYMQEHPEDLEKIEKLKDLIAWQVRLEKSCMQSRPYFALFHWVTLIKTVLKGYWSHIWLLSVLRNIKGADYVSPLIISLFIFNISGWTCWIAVVFFKWTSSFLQRDHLCFECIYKYSSIIICVSGGIKWGFSLAGKSLTAHNYIFKTVLFINFPLDKSK